MATTLWVPHHEEWQPYLDDGVIVGSELRWRWCAEVVMESSPRFTTGLTNVGSASAANNRLGGLWFVLHLPMLVLEQALILLLGGGLLTLAVRRERRKASA